eukprot:TRINITY_DN2873_c0_g1_i5.p1 TRINITY_DN2873_c0_g1~~TRINITY_DN2873_c0_g1_i5.p1  ORF type:complete len:617 (-),score=115.86 TRINITY_DN2873_c0_g1_i5:84-1934(-)
MAPTHEASPLASLRQNPLYAGSLLVAVIATAVGISARCGASGVAQLGLVICVMVAARLGAILAPLLAADVIKTQEDLVTLSTPTSEERAEALEPIVFEDNKPELGYDIVCANLFAALASGVYLGDDLWSSRRPMPETVLSVRDMSTWAKFKWGSLGQSGDWGLKALSSSFDCGDENFSMKAGWIDSRSTDTQGILALHPTNKWVVLVFRGTESVSDMAVDANCFGTPHPYLPGNPKVHNGFLTAYLCVRDAALKACALFDGSDDSPTEMHITGHSLGAALATLAAVDIAITLKGAAAKRGDGVKPPDVVVHTFGSPCVGQAEFVALYDKEVTRTFRHVNDRDIVAVTPPSFIGHQHVGTHVGMNEDVVIVHPMKDDKRLADDDEGGASEFVTDHMMSNYQRLLRRAIVRERIPKQVFEAVRESWINMFEAPVVRRPVFVRPSRPPWDSLVVKHVGIPFFHKMMEEVCFREELGFDYTLIGLIRAEMESRPSVCMDEMLYIMWVMHYTDNEMSRSFYRRQAALRQVFNAYDTNLDHHLDLNELTQLLTDASLARGLPAVSRERAESILAGVDVDSNYEISFEEFFTAVKLGNEEFFEMCATYPVDQLVSMARHRTAT